ncbi:MAG: hypothetical protein C4289_07240, partial [Chloroflexota bacterium]
MNSDSRPATEEPEVEHMACSSAGGTVCDHGIAEYYARLREVLARLPLAEIERALALLLDAYR